MITVSISLSFLKVGVSSTASIDVAKSGFQAVNYSSGASSRCVSTAVKTNMTMPSRNGFCYWKNIGDVTVDIGPDDSGTQRNALELRETEFALLRLAPGVVASFTPSAGTIVMEYLNFEQ